MSDKPSHSFFVSNNSSASQFLTYNSTFVCPCFWSSFLARYRWLYMNAEGDLFNWKSAKSDRKYQVKYSGMITCVSDKLNQNVT